jgi:hypothetical protein
MLPFYVFSANPAARDRDRLRLVKNGMFGQNKWSSGSVWACNFPQIWSNALGESDGNLRGPGKNQPDSRDLVPKQMGATTFHPFGAITSAKID